MNSILNCSRISNWEVTALLLCALLLSCGPALAYKDIDCYIEGGCDRSSSSSVSPSSGAQVKINPSAVPTEQGMGLEGIYFKNEVDLSLVRGNGRMGASISPSNSENTFFGSPALELSSDLIQRKEYRQKYPNQKVTLATAFNLKKPTGSGIKKTALKLGVMGKYNKLSKNVAAGAGLSGILGPFDFGYSLYDDETQIDYGSDIKENYKYRVKTYNIGLHLTSLVLVYSNLYLETPDQSYVAKVNLYTASLTLRRFILTGSKRIEDSPALAYNYENQTLETKQIKEEYFGGIQYVFSKNITMGLLYNYYLLREYSVTGTLYF